MTAEPRVAAPAKRSAKRPDSILIYGLQKTGTTGMYNTVKQALAPAAADYYFLFEPSTPAAIRSVRRADPTVGVLAKVIAHRTRQSFPFASFQRRVMMVRDPRDTVISTLLFKPLIRSTVGLDMSLHEQFIAALERKEKDPGSTSVTELLELGASLGYKNATPARAVEIQETLIATGDEHEFHPLSYERFVDGDLDEVSEYLDIPLQVSRPDTTTWLDHISRSRDHGAWRHWFTPADVDHYRPYFANFLTRFGYGDDWDLASPQVIDPATSSVHVRNSLAKRRGELQDVNRGDEVESGFDLHTQYTMAVDGSVSAAIAVAEHLLALDRGYTKSARYWAHRAEMQGSEQAEALRIEIDRRFAPRSRNAEPASKKPAPSPTTDAAAEGTPVSDRATYSPSAVDRTGRRTKAMMKVRKLVAVARSKVGRAR